MKFETNDAEHEAISKWLAEHTKTCQYWQSDEHGRLPQGASGGAITYCFTPTSIGLVTQIRCACNEWHDITDYDTW